MIEIEINGYPLPIETTDNSSAEAFQQLLAKGSLTLSMKDYAHMEKYGRLPVYLPQNDRRMSVKAGDVILSEGNLLVLYYAPNTWNFTLLGRIVGVDEQRLKQILGTGSLQATISLVSSSPFP